MRRENTLNSNFVTNVPQGPKHRPNASPQHVASLPSICSQAREDVSSCRRVPIDGSRSSHDALMDTGVAAARLRAALRGWGANRGCDDKLLRVNLVAELASLDQQADSLSFSEAEWAHRYALENQVLAIIRAEEEYWRRRGGIKWMLKGDANTGHFHAYANGWKRKCAILRLQSEQGLLLSKEAITKHIYEFYMQLMGSEEPKLAGIRADLWGQPQQVYPKENKALLLAFTPEEVDAALSSMKSDTAPGPDG